MRKKLLFAGLLVFALSLCACSSTKSGNVSDLTNTGSDLINVPGLDETQDDYYDDEYTGEEEIVHDTEYYPTTFDGLSYESTIDSLGKFTGLEYSYAKDYVASEEEINQNIQEMLEMYEFTDVNQEVLEAFGFESESELRDYIKSNIEYSEKEEQYATASSDLLDKVINASTFTIKDSDIQELYNEQLESYKEMATYFGVTYEELCEQYFNMTTEELESEILSDSELSIRTTLTVNAIIDKANIDIKSLWDVESAELLEEYGYEDAWEFIDYNGGEEYLMSEVRYKIVIEYLMENGTNLTK